MLLGCGALLFLGLALHPFLTYPLSLGIARRLGWARPNSVSSDVAPTKLTVVFCAFNEQRVLADKLDNLLGLRAACPEFELEILVYDDCSADRTPEILGSYAGRIDFLRGEARAGKSAGMNRLVERATGEIVIFTDANVMLSSELIRSFAGVFRDPEVGVACSHLVYVNEETATASAGTSYWRLEETIKQLESETGSVMGADGSAFAIRRRLHVPAPQDVDDDFHTSMSILSQGYRIVRCRDALAWEKSVTQSGQEFFRKVRIACRAINCHRRLRPALRRMSLWNRYKYYSHKWVRWHTALWLVLASLCVILFAFSGYGPVAGFAVAALAVGGVAAAWLLNRAGVPKLGSVWEVLLAFVATMYGVWRAFRGERFETWTPASSAR